MAEYEVTHSLNIKRQAEREMAAFLKAVKGAVGQGGLLQAGDVWLRAMESLDWPDVDHKRFFRRVSVIAISQLLASSNANMRDEKREKPHGANWLPVLRTAL
jgi:hypothetical protein